MGDAGDVKCSICGQGYPLSEDNRHKYSCAGKLPQGVWPKKEVDPLGKDPHEPGAKLDSGKQLPFTVLGSFAPALQGITKVGTYGAVKYTINGWISVPDGRRRYYEALLRHLLEDMMCPESLDLDTGISHLDHAAWNILAILTLRKSHIDIKS